MKEINEIELKQIQLDILTDVHQFCQANGLTYFLDYGTLIGAIRHNGFIPWDDDIDISMPRPDYEKFIHTYRTHSTYKVFAHSIDSDYHLPFAKVADTRTIMHEYMYKKEPFGVYIDVFPIDGVDDLQKQNKCLRRLSQFLNTKKAVLSLRTRTFKKNAVIFVGKLILLGVSVDDIIDKMVKNATKKAFEEADQVATLVEVPYSDNEIFSKESVLTTIDHVFEDRMFRIPADYHHRLTTIYGDYMKLPPEDKRQSTHTFYAYWKE